MATLENINNRISELKRDIEGMMRSHDKQMQELQLSLPIWQVSEDYRNAVEELDFLEWFRSCLKASDKVELDEDKARDLYIEYKY